VTARACEAFRREFEPGKRTPHGETCSACRAWADGVESWRTLGTRAPLPDSLRARLVRLPRQGDTGLQEIPALPPPPPLPGRLRARLVQIPRAARRRERVLKARYVVAASYLLAGLLSLATGGAALAVPGAPPATRIASRGLGEASARGTQLLLQLGGWIFDGCERANQSAENLIDRLGSRPRGGEPQAPHGPEKEKDHGTRTTP